MLSNFKKSVHLHNFLLFLVWKTVPKLGLLFTYIVSQISPPCIQWTLLCSCEVFKRHLTPVSTASMQYGTGLQHPNPYWFSTFCPHQHMSRDHTAYLRWSKLLKRQLYSTERCCSSMLVLQPYAAMIWRIRLSTKHSTDSSTNLSTAVILEASALQTASKHATLYMGLRWVHRI